MFTTLRFPATCAVVLLLAAGTADAALTSEKCLALKRRAHGDFAKCRADAAAKALEAKPADAAACAAKLAKTLGKLTARAAEAAVECRYVVGEEERTFTDYDTGLQWEMKEGADGVAQPSNPHDVDNTYSWSALFGSPHRDGTAFSSFLATLNDCDSSDFVSHGGGLAGRCDWRLPTTAELLTVLLQPPGNGPCGPPCVAPIFLPTEAYYWTSITLTSNRTIAVVVDVRLGVVEGSQKHNTSHVRAVRTAF